MISETSNLPSANIFPNPAKILYGSNWVANKSLIRSIKNLCTLKKKSKNKFNATAVTNQLFLNTSLFDL